MPWPEAVGDTIGAAGICRAEVPLSNSGVTTAAAAASTRPPPPATARNRLRQVAPRRICSNVPGGGISSTGSGCSNADS
ncbi:hypothetical protein ABH940_005102 [Streptacidiphilus sp. BW17]